ncbi:glutathione S-transferase N-terminal domain-containing protein [Moritella sp. 24]|uniref:glutathione S-transferase N-terminal domain-containing protein n=1 Tax=Moritella sp. 24 TaxID=2746230 RepID=UPI001BA49236|nr:glutathione S-transferase N-terminal domain-containing protein [Moritella sp. 24]QUM75978.1 glutathione S-transferase N-terminal domain-containing protein [Moritella sp. 24]
MANIQLYSLGSPNGIKIPIALEEMGLDYDVHTVDITKGEQHSDEFKKINPNTKIPAIVDLAAGEDMGHPIMESGAILLYLAEKSGKLLSKNPIARSETIQWLFFQASAIGPMFGAFGHFHTYSKDKCDHPYPEQRFTNETTRLLGILNDRLQHQTYIIGNEYSIADIAIFPWVIWLDVFYNASVQLELNSFPHVLQWLEVCKQRPATIRGFDVYGFSEIGKSSFKK